VGFCLYRLNAQAAGLDDREFFSGIMIFAAGSGGTLEGRTIAAARLLPGGFS
jgi:hypothetical protein